MFTLDFWKGAAERGIKTFFQSLIPSFIITAPIVEQPWLPALGIAATATVLSIATSIGNADFVAGAPDVDPATAITADSKAE